MVFNPTIFQLHHGRSFIGGGNQSAQRNPQICRKSLINYIPLTISMQTKALYI